MKRLSIVAILLVALLSLVGCNGITTYDQREYEALPSTAKIVEETIIEEEQQEEKETKTEEDNFEYGALVADTQYQKTQKGVEKVMLVRIVSENEIEELNPDYIIVDGVVYTNPRNNPNIDLKALGYKNFFIDDLPEFDGETQKVERYYYENGDTIHRGWKIYNLTKEEIEQREQMIALMKGE